LRVINGLLLAFLIYVSEDIVKNEISGRLLGEDECLDKLLEFGGFVGCFTDDLNDDIVVGSLGIDVRDADFAVLEIEFFNSLLNSLLILDCELDAVFADLHFDRQKLEPIPPRDQKRTGNAFHRKAMIIVSASPLMYIV